MRVSCDVHVPYGMISRLREMDAHAMRKGSCTNIAG